jgi:hypothetical protein
VGGQLPPRISLAWTLQIDETKVFMSAELVLSSAFRAYHWKFTLHQVVAHARMCSFEVREDSYSKTGLPKDEDKHGMWAVSYFSLGYLDAQTFIQTVLIDAALMRSSMTHRTYYVSINQVHVIWLVDP